MWHDETFKSVIDATSVGVVVGALTNYLPAIAAGVSIIWGLIRIAETDTVQALLRKRGWAWIGQTQKPDDVIITIGTQLIEKRDENSISSGEKIIQKR